MLMFITKNLHRFFAGIILIALVTVSILMSSGVNAQSTGLGAVPRKDMSVAEGTKADSSLNLTNLNKTTALKVTIDLIDFKSANETGSPALQLDQGADPTPWSLKPFISIPKEITLQAGETKSIPYTITIPKKQGAGSYYSAIRYSAAAEDRENVTISASAATLVFVTVPGKATEQLNLKKFGAYDIGKDAQNGSFKSLFTNSQPKKLAYLLENTGNVAESPVGSIEITNMFGKRVRVIQDANPKRNVALIGQTRRFETCLQTQVRDVNDNGIITKVESCKSPGLMPGMYKAHLNLLYGISGSETKEVDTTAVFWYMPLWVIAAVIGVLAIIAYVIYVVQHKIRARTQRKD